MNNLVRNYWHVGVFAFGWWILPEGPPRRYYVKATLAILLGFLLVILKLF